MAVTKLWAGSVSSAKIHGSEGQAARRGRALVLGIWCSLALSSCGSTAAEAVVTAELAARDSNDVWTQHYDNARTGATLNEVRLTVSSVSPLTFGKLFVRRVDGPIYAQPLYRSGVSLGGVMRNVVYVATVEGSIYAFDADEPSATEPLLQRSLLDVAAVGSRPVRNTDVGQICVPYRDFTGNLAIVGTPVIDLSTDTIYVVTKIREPKAFVQRLHALDLLTLAERPNSPVIIEASVSGTGAGASHGRIAFDPEIQNQRAALLLASGNVYTAWASHCDTGPYHGWIIGYDASSLRQSFVFNDTADGVAGGIWQAGQGVAAAAHSGDASGVGGRKRRKVLPPRSG